MQQPDWQERAPPPELAARSAPRIPTESVATCLICGASRHETLAVGFDYELLTCSNPWRFVVCADCGHVWLHPRPAAAALGTIYPPTYYAYNYGKISPVARKGKELLDRGKMRSILRSLGRPPRSFLDVGCGDGRYLAAIEREGVPRHAIYGLELDEAVVSRLASRGFQVFCETVEDCSRIPNASIDLITMFHVIEHVADPRAVVRKLASWLAPGGLLALETPNLDSVDARRFAHGTWGGYHIPRHWHLFTPETLSRLLEESDLEMVGVRYQTGHSFWMYSFHHALRYAPTPRPVLARRFDPLRSVFFLSLFTAFDKLRAAIGFKTSAMLLLARRAA